MTQARMSLPRSTSMLTRSTVMGLYLLAPGKTVNQILEYCLVWAAQRRGIRIHAFSAQSNHYHLVVTDPAGLLSEFMQDFNRGVACCLLAYYRKRFPERRMDAVWSPAQSFSQQFLVNAAGIRDKIAYSVTNPVKDGMVSQYQQWPGLRLCPDDWGTGTRTVRRPPYYVKHTPEELTYEVVPPTQLDGPLEQVVADANHVIDEHEARARATLAAKGRRFAGLRRIKATDPFDAPRGQRPRGNLNPTVAAGGDARAFANAVRAVKRFRSAYREAWRRFNATVKRFCATYREASQRMNASLEHLFPGGTLLMHRRYGCARAPLDARWCHLATPS